MWCVMQPLVWVFTKEFEMKTAPLQIALAGLMEATDETRIAVDVADDGIWIHWCGVIELKTIEPLAAAKAILLFKQLEALGAEDC